MLDVLEEFELTVGAFRQDSCAERSRDLLDGDRCACEFDFCGTGWGMRVEGEGEGEDTPYETRFAFRNTR